MNKKVVIICAVLTMALLSVSILSYIHIKNICDETQSLSDKVEALEKVNVILQTENDGLCETLDSVRGQNKTPAEPSETLRQKDDSLLDTIFDANPIDIYFLEMANKIVPTTTAEMMEYGYIECLAWEAEMINCYEMLASKTNIEDVRECLEKERTSYIEYIKNNTEIDIYINLSGSFYGEENPVVGTLSHVWRPSAWAEGYRNKTKKLFNRLNEIGVTPQFVFSEEEYGKKIQQTLPELWKDAFG